MHLLLTHLLRGDDVDFLGLSESCFHGTGGSQWHLLVSCSKVIKVIPPVLAVVFTSGSFKQVPNICLVKVDKVGWQVHVDGFIRSLFASSLYYGVA